VRRTPGVPLLVGPEVRERIRWRDVDVMGVVYYGNYLRFMEAAETEFFRAADFSYDRLAEEFGVWIARIRLECDYRVPARLDDEIACRAELRKVGGSSLTFTFPIERADGTRLVDGRLVLAALDRASLRPVPLPTPLRASLARPPARKA